MQGVHLGREELIRQYGLTRRLAVRVTALLARAVEVTPTLLEIAGPGSAIEKLLLHPEFLEKAGHLTTDDVTTLAAETGAVAEGRLAIVISGACRVLALEEELVPDAAGEETEPGNEGLPAVAAADSLPAAPALLDRDEMQHVFPPDEVARIKLEALTGSDEAAQVAALRKLRYAPLSAREKGGIYLRALLDPAGKARGEAIRGLESLGFDRDAADAIQVAFEGDARTRKAALRRIADLVAGRSPAELQIIVAALIEMFREARPLQPDDPLLPVLNEIAPEIARQPAMVTEIARVCVQHMMVDPRRLGRPLRDLLLRLAETDARPLLDRLWEETHILREPAPRAIVLGLLMDLERDERRTGELCALVTDEILRPEHDELTRQRLGHHMTLLGVTAAHALLDSFARRSPPERARLLPFIDTLCCDHGLPAEESRQAAAHLIEALKIGDRRLRMEVLRTRVFHGPHLGPKLVQALVAELVPMLRPREEPDVTSRAAMLLEMLGQGAAPALLKLIKDRPGSPVADAAVRILGTVLARDGADGRMAASVRQFAAKRVGQRTNKIGGYAAALGQIGAAPFALPEETRSAFALCAGQLGRAPYHADLVQAIGRLAALPACTAEQRVRAAHLLGALVERPADEEETELREIDTDDGKAYELAGRIDFESETLPAAIEGLRGIAMSSATTEALRTQITEQFIRVWRGVADWTVVWGPNSSETLALTLGALAADARTPEALRAEIIVALGMALERSPVIRALAQALAAPSRSAEVNRLAVETAERALGEWIDPDITPDELRMVLAAAAAAAARPRLNARTKAVRALRERTCELLFDCLRSGHAWARDLLEGLRDAPSLPRSMHKEIAERLRKTSQLDRVR